MPDFRKQILDQMELKGISKQDLNILSGVYYTTVCGFFRGEEVKFDKTIVRILDALDLDLIIKPRSKQDA